MKRGYKHLFFDLDHTLWDFQANSAHTLRILFEAYSLAEKLQTDVEHFLERYYGINEKMWAQYRAGSLKKEALRATRFLETFRSFGFVDAALSSKFDAEYIELSPRQTRLIDGTIDLLNHLTEQEDFRLHIITNGFEEIQAIKLENSGIRNYFDVIMTSERVGVTKPNAKIFMEALSLAKATRKESLMIGDNLLADVVGARNCGIDQVYFNPQAVQHKESVTLEVKRLEEIKAFLS